MSLTPAVRRTSITATDNPEQEKRRSLQDQIDALAKLPPRKSIHLDPDRQGQYAESEPSQIDARMDSPQNLDLQTPLSPSSQIQSRRDSSQQFGLQPQSSPHPSQIETRKNSPQNLGIQGLKSESSQLQTLNQESVQPLQQQQPPIFQSAQIQQTPKQSPPGIHEESAHVEVKDDSITYGVAPAGLPPIADSQNVMVYEWKGTKGRELTSRLPPTKQRADRHDEMHLDNLPNSTADAAWTFLDTIPVEEKPAKTKAKPFDFENLQPLEKQDSVQSLAEPIKSVEPSSINPSYVEPGPYKDNDKVNDGLPEYVPNLPEDSEKEQKVKEVVESLMSIVFSGNPTKARVEKLKPVKEKKPHPKPLPPPKKKPPKKVKQPKPPKQEQYYEQALPQKDFLHFDQTIPTQEFALQQQQQPQQQYNQQMHIQPQVATQQQIGILPPRSTAFQAPFVPLRSRDPGYPTDGSDPNFDEDDGLNFSFNPRADCATEVTFTVEPRKRPMWQTMMNCGFTPVIYCSVPPCCLPGNGVPGQPGCGGTQAVAGSSSEDSSSGSGSTEESSDDDDQGGAVNAGRGQGQGRGQGGRRPSIKPVPIVEKNYGVNLEPRHSIASRKFSIKSSKSSKGRANSIYQQSEKGDSLDFSSSE